MLVATATGFPFARSRVLVRVQELGFGAQVSEFALGSLDLMGWGSGFGVGFGV